MERDFCKLWPTRCFSVLLGTTFFVMTAPSIVLLKPVPTFALGQTSQTIDEDEVRLLTNKFAQAISAGDLEAMRQLWDPQSPELAARLRSYQVGFFRQRVELIKMNVTRMEITGNKAISDLTSDERYLDKKTGALLSEADAYYGVCRSLEWAKTVAGWKLEREVWVQDELAAKLDAAPSEPEREELLTKEKVFVTNALLHSLGARGHRYRVRLDFDAALRCYQLQQTVAEKIGDQTGIATALGNIGVLKYSQQEFDEALQLQQRALAIFETLGQSRGVALALSKLGEVYHGLGDERRAFECSQKSLRLYEETKDRLRQVDVLNSLAEIYDAQNDVQQALLYVQRALTLAQELGDPIQIAIVRHVMARQYQALGDYERALEIYQDLLKQTERFGDLGGAATIRAQIGTLYAEQRKYDEAINYHRQALSAIETVNSKRLLAESLNDLCADYLALGRYTETLPLAQRAVSASRQAPWQADLWHSLASLGYAELGLNHLSEARQAFTEAIPIVEKLRAQTVGGAEDRARYLEGRLLAHLGMFDLLIKENHPFDAFVYAERMKARVLLDVLENGRISIQKAMTPQEREDERRLKSDLAQLNLRLARAAQSEATDAKRVSELTALVEKARGNYEVFQSSLYAAHPELANLRGEAPPITLEQLAALIPDAHSALLEYVVTDNAVNLFVLTKASEGVQPEVHYFSVPIKRDELTRQAEDFRRQLADRDLAFGNSARGLYDLLVKPAQAELRGKTSLVIVPDDVLWDLPFQALQTAAHHSLIEDAAVSYAPSLTVLREMSKRRLKREGGRVSTLLAFGNPTSSKDATGQPGLRDVKLQPLPEAEEEVKALTQVYGAAHSKVYVGAGASEDRAKAEAGQAGILHFATHAILNNAAPMYSRLLLSPGGGEDGLLEASELLQLDLKAELAVLSACETARGRFGAGEGMIGWSWALFVAGVPTTVVSQWRVEAASTRDLMVDFHRALNSEPKAGRTRPGKAEALRQAELKLMKNPETRHPFYWAGFVVVGDGS